MKTYMISHLLQILKDTSTHSLFFSNSIVYLKKIMLVLSIQTPHHFNTKIHIKKSILPNILSPLHFPFHLLFITINKIQL